MGCYAKGVHVVFPAGLCRSHAGTVVATADDFGKVRVYICIFQLSFSFRIITLFDLFFCQVKLFKWPCVAKAPVCRQYCGHSSHVHSVRFTKSDQYLVPFLPLYCLFEQAGSRVISHRGARSPSEGQTCLSCRCHTPPRSCSHLQTQTLMQVQWRHVPFVDDKGDASVFY